MTVVLCSECPMTALQANAVVLRYAAASDHSVFPRGSEGPGDGSVGRRHEGVRELEGVVR